MRFNAILALTSLFASVISAPVAGYDTVSSLQNRATDAVSIIDTLNGAIVGPMASIKSTLATISSSSSVSDKSAAESVVSAYVGQMVSAVNAATAQASTLTPASERLVRRQNETSAISEALTTLLTDVNTVAEELVSDLGLTDALSILNPLVSSLSGLLLSLEVVVNNLLAVVQEIVDGLLGGLSAALAGLVL